MTSERLLEIVLPVYTKFFMQAIARQIFGVDPKEGEQEVVTNKDLSGLFFKATYVAVAATTEFNNMRINGISDYLAKPAIEGRMASLDLMYPEDKTNMVFPKEILSNDEIKSFMNTVEHAFDEPMSPADIDIEGVGIGGILNLLKGMLGESVDNIKQAIGEHTHDCDTCDAKGSCPIEAHIRAIKAKVNEDGNSDIQVMAIKIPSSQSRKDVN